MKKFYKIAILVLVFCLCFTTAAFGAGVGPKTDASTEEGQTLYTCKNLPFAPGDEFQLVTLDDVAWRSGEYSGASTVASIPSKFPHFDTPTETPLLVLVLEFSNMKYQNNYDWGSTIFQGQYSLAKYYSDQSFNQFTFVPVKETSAYNVNGNHNTKDKANDGVVHITLDSSHGNWDLDSDSEVKKMIAAFVEGVKKADAYVDFSTFDKNHDGEITTDEMALAIVVAGYEAAADQYLTEGSNYYLWSHAWGMYSGWYYYYSSQYPDYEDFLPMPDGVLVESYIAIAEQMEKGYQEPISVLAHELGHYLGLPDLYDTDYATNNTWSKYDVSFLSVMCSGAWGWNTTVNDYLPVGFDAWSKCCLGWVVPETVNSGTHDVFSDQTNQYNVLRVETGVSGDYYLLENREFAGWDSALNMKSSDGWSAANCYGDWTTNGGLVCWHIDDAVYNQYADSNEVNNTYHRPSVMPLYPETKNGKVTFIGTLNNSGLAQPFFTYGIWNGTYAGTLDCIDFPTYNKKNTLNGRTFSGVQMNFLPTPGAHTIRVTFGDIEYNEIIRLSGKDRYDTGIAAANQLKKVNGLSKFDRIIVASGADFPDALSASYLAVKKEAPILLVGKDATSINKVTTYINSNLASGGTVYIVGGKGAVSEDVANAITGTVKRLSGSNRYLTNLAVLEEAGLFGEGLLVASGQNYADALSASAVGKPILLVGATLNADQKAYLEANKAYFGNSAYIIGGSGAVSDAVETDIKTYANTVKRVKGSNRFLTSQAVAEQFFSTNVETMVIASGLAFPDGLSGGPVATAYNAPLILVGPNNYDHAVSFFQSKGAATLVVMGGKGAVPKEIAEAVAYPATETA